MKTKRTIYLQKHNIPQRILGSLLLFLFITLPGSSWGQTIDSLDVNRLVPKVHSNGHIGHDTVNYDPGVTYHSDSNGVLFSGGLWITGKGTSGDIHASCQKFQSTDEEDNAFHKGPIADNYGPSHETRYDRVWTLDRDSLEYHANNWWKSGYQVPQMIQEWPAHGDTSNGEAHQLSKYRDINNNNVYDPQNGDRPIMRGDRALYFISNDTAGPSSQKALGVEVHGMIYAWDCPGNEALNNSFFVHYEIINRSSESYDSVMVGEFADMDIGCTSDDYLGTDAERGVFFGYNGDGYDQTCNGQGYDSIPPAFGISFLKGPQVDSNGVDDAFQGPGYGSINGTGFNDGTVDNEAFGMQRSMAFIFNGGLSAPNTVAGYFYYMHNATSQGDTIMEFGGEGYSIDSIASPDDTGSVLWCPWDSDPQYYATGGAPHDFWSEDSAGNSQGDRRGVASSGPVTLPAGDTLKFDLAFVAAQDPDTTGSHSPIDELKARVDSVRQYYRNDQVPCSDGSFSSIPETESSFSAKAFPNPSGGHFKIELKGPGRSYRYELYNIRGSLIKSGHWNGKGTRALRIEGEGEGLYFLRIRSEGESKVLKLVKR